MNVHSDLVKVKGNPNLARDPKSSGIINTDMKEYSTFLAEKKRKEATNQRLLQVEGRLQRIEQLLEALLDAKCNV